MDAKLSVTVGLDHLAERLDPIITERFPEPLGDRSWTVLLSRLDENKGYAPKMWSRTDLSAQLMMFTQRLGPFGYPFDDRSHTVSTLAKQIKLIRNLRAHGGHFEWVDAFRAHDCAARLLEHFGDEEGAAYQVELRDGALAALAREKGIGSVADAGRGVLGTQAVPSLEESDDKAADETVDEAGMVDEDELVEPEPRMRVRESGRSFDSPVLARLENERMDFEEWVAGAPEDPAIIDELPLKGAKMRLRALAVDIVEVEGPVSLARLTRLLARTCGKKRLGARKARQIAHQVGACEELYVDEEKFVWPADVEPQEWREFRPNSSAVQRDFMDVSPVEVANAMRFVRVHFPEADEAELERLTLSTFGRKRRTADIKKHLDRARAHLDA